MRFRPTPKPRFGNLDGVRIPPEKWARRIMKWRLGKRYEPVYDDFTNAPATPWAGTRAHLESVPDGTRVTWLGHATNYVEHGAHAVITDPTFGTLAFLKQRLAPAPLPAHELPRLDGILISHNHFDHCDLRSIRSLRARFPDAPIVVPEGLAPWMRSKVGSPVVELPWWETLTLGPFRIHATPAQHWSTRAGLDICQSHWMGILMETPSHGVFFAGDTGFGPHFEAIAARLKVDVALLPVGAYAPRWFMRDQHMNPEDAVAAARILGAHLIPIHWGTYGLADEPHDEPPRWTEQLAHEAQVPLSVLRPGGAWSVDEVVGLWQHASPA